MRALRPEVVQQAVASSAAAAYPAFGSVQARLAEVSLEAAVTLIPQASASRVETGALVMAEYRKHGLTPFAPVADDAGRAHVGCLVEASEEGLVILDGMHRCLAARTARLPVILALVISPQHRPRLAGRCYRLKEVEVLPLGVDPPAFYWGRGNQDFRPGLQIVQDAARRIEEEAVWTRATRGTTGP